MFSINGYTVSGSVKVIKNTSSNVLCHSISKPDPDFYEWTYPGGTYIGQTITIKAEVGGTHSCIVKNTMLPTEGPITIGNNTGSFSLDILCKYGFNKVTRLQYLTNKRQVHLSMAKLQTIGIHKVNSAQIK